MNFARNNMDVLWVILLACGTFVSPQLTPTYLGAINITYAGFTNIYEHPGWVEPTERYSLLVSTMSGVPFTQDSSYMFQYVGYYLDDLENFVPTLVNDSFLFPREPGQTPESAFGFETITQPDGFIIPGKRNGSVHVSDIRDLDEVLTYDIIRDPNDPDPRLWFYHRVTWKDVDGDGLLDALTCRVSDEGGEYITEMLWFQQPASDPLTQPWKPTIINQNICGTFQSEMTFDLPGGPVYALFTVGYFTRILAVHWSTAPDDSWLNPADIETRVIDVDRGFFDIDIADINLDGGLELLVTWNAEFNGSFVTYEIPDDFRTGNYTVHVLADGFDSRNDDPGGGTPGVGLAFYASSDTSEKPWIVLSGDDDGRMYYLTAVSQAPDDWQYDLITIRDEGPAGILGRPSVMDVDGDGYSEIFFPSYYGDGTYVYTFKP